MWLQSKALDCSHMKLHGSRNPVCPCISTWLQSKATRWPSHFVTLFSGVIQYVAGYCRVLQHVAACCSRHFSLIFPAQWWGSSVWRSRWQCVAVFYNALLCFAMRCRVLQFSCDLARHGVLATSVALRRFFDYTPQRRDSSETRVMQSIAMCCNALQCVPVVMWSVSRSVDFWITHHTDQILVKPEWCNVLQCVAACCSRHVICVAVRRLFDYTPHRTDSTEPRVKRCTRRIC